MRFATLLYFYGRRLRTRPAQELLAGLGIALGVALVFAVQAANSSITSSSGEIVRSIVGPATLQLRSRDEDGFEESLVERVQRLSGVVRAAPLLELPATIIAPDGRRITVQVASADPSLGLLDGLASEVPLRTAVAAGIMLPSATAQALGLATTVGHAIEGPRPHVALELRGHASSVKVTAILGRETIGPLAGAKVAIAPLWVIQSLAGLPGRVTRVLIQSAPGREALVRGELERVAAGRLAVVPATQDVALLKQALGPNAQATGFFALVSGLVGLLLAFNAMLLTAPERRRTIADLRIQGFRPWQLVQMLLFQAACLGMLASLVGLVVGDILAQSVFHQTPNYLSAAFPLGSQTVIGLQAALISFVGGVLATCLAAAPPLLDLRRGRAADRVYLEEGEPGHALSIRTRVWLLAGGIALVAATSGLLLVDPGATIVATVGLAVAMLLAIPAVFTATVWAAGSLAAYAGGRLNPLLVATRALRATPARSLALAATGAIAVFGSVLVNGSHQDLLNGLYSDYGQYVGTADIWLTNDGDDLATMDFRPHGVQARIASLPDVTEVRSYQGGYLDIDGRRVWLIARSPAVKSMIQPSQIVSGNVARATALLHAGGWITISQQLALAMHVKAMRRIVLPTPTGLTTYRVAAITTNLGWSAGAIVLNTSDYRRAWASADPSALEVDVRRGTSSAVRREILRLVGLNSGLQVQTSAQRAATADALARQGLSRLSQISMLLVFVAALAMAAAMGAAIWQRRSSLASLRIQSFQPSQLRLVLLYESGLVLGASCLVGVGAGIYGHLLADRYLMRATGFPTSPSLQGFEAFGLLLLVLAAAFAVLAIPSYLAAQTPPAMALEAF